MTDKTVVSGLKKSKKNQKKSKKTQKNTKKPLLFVQKGYNIY